MPTTILPNGRKQFINGSGTPLASGTVYYYVPGTTTLKTTWQDAAQATPNTNPITLDSNGTALVWGSGSYREVVYDSSSVLLWDAVTADTSAFATGTSTTSLTIGTGSMTLTTQTGLNFNVGQYIGVSNTTTPTDYMIGVVTAYTSSTGSLTFTSNQTNGSGTFASWNIVSTGVVGAGATPGSNSVTNAILAQAPANTLKGNNTGLTANEADLTIAQVLAMLGAFAVLNVQFFSGSGTYTPTSGMVYCLVFAQGAGGGGGGLGSSAGNESAGSGGGAGGLGISFYTAAQIGSSQTVTIGAAGTAGSNSGGNGGAGGNTTFGALITGGGGSGGTGINSSPGNMVNGGAGNNSTGANIVNCTGQQGGPSLQWAGSSSRSASGWGGNAAFLGLGGASMGVASSAGINGLLGGGGSGANGAASLAGGAGGAGYVMVIEFCT